MVCAVIRWLVSREHDTGRTLPKFAVRHLERCSGCRGFAAETRSLGEGLRREARQALGPFATGFRHATTAPSGAPPFHGRWARMRLRPVSTVAALAAVAGFAVLLFRVPENPVTPPSDGPLILTSRATLGVNLIDEATKRVASPMEAEMNRLGTSVTSAARRLLFSLQLGAQGAPDVDRRGKGSADGNRPRKG